MDIYKKNNIIAPINQKKTKMRKLSILFVAASCSLFLFSCKKSSSSTTSSTGTISASLNGTTMAFNTDALGVASSSSGLYSVEIEGADGTPTGSLDVPTIAIEFKPDCNRLNFY